MSALEHLHHLSDTIGPRPATTDAEAEAADYIESVFRARAVEVDRQEFDSPRTYSWAYALYHLLTIGAAVASGWSFLAWPAFAIAALTAFLLWMDLDTRFGLSSWLPPKGPSQNVIARHVPRARRGERPTRVVIVAHYDSARASLAFAPSMVKNLPSTFALMKVCTFAVPALVLLGALPFTEAWDPWLWYATIAAGVYLVVPLLINVHREIAMDFTDGANDNASGVAVMLDVFARITDPAEERGLTGMFERERGDTRNARPVAAADSAKDAAEDGVATLPDDFCWAETGTDETSADGGTRRGLSTGSDILSVGHIEFGTARESASEPAIPLREPGDAGKSEESPVSGGFAGMRGRITRSFRDRKGRRGREGESGGWFGSGRDPSARDEGRKIGSWDRFGDDDDDEYGYKGGRAGEDFLLDPEYPTLEASRIRRRVSEHVDRALSEKEVWFVATGAEEVGTFGMRALIDAYPEEMKRALIINLDNLGEGTLHMVTCEGMARRYRSDRRLLTAGKRVAVENGLPVRARPYKGLSTDATPALARGLRAMSVMAFDVNGRLPHWHWRTDTTEHVSAENLKAASDFVVELIRSV